VLTSQEHLFSSARTTVLDAKVRQEYDRLAAVYDRRWHHYVQHTLEFLKDWAAIPPAAKVLDIACGTGEFERLVLHDHPQQQMVGVDLSEQMLAIAQKKCSDFANVTFQAATVTALPFDHQSFDTVVCASAFHYFEAPAASLLEMKRLLKPQGRLIILDWCRDYFPCKVLDSLLKIFDPVHAQCYTQAELQAFLNEAGFCTQRTAKTHVGLIWELIAVEAILNPTFNH
jgi:ubiquinone/menaquinone biosynthesis C-methylase UbiE